MVKTANSQPTDGNKVKARVIVDGPFGKVNDVVTFDTLAAAEAAAAQVDASAGAVAYAESLQKISGT